MPVHRPISPLYKYILISAEAANASSSRPVLFGKAVHRRGGGILLCPPAATCCCSAPTDGLLERTSCCVRCALISSSELGSASVVLTAPNAALGARRIEKECSLSLLDVLSLQAGGRERAVLFYPRVFTYIPSTKACRVYRSPFLRWMCSPRLFARRIFLDFVVCFCFCLFCRLFFFFPGL